MLNVNDLELKLRIIESEIREIERKKEKCWDNVLGIIFAFVIILGIGSYYLFARKEEILVIILSVILLLICLVSGPYWYTKYKSACQKLKKLERELYLLKKGLKKD